MPTADEVRQKGLNLLAKLLASHVNFYYKLLGAVAQRAASENYGVEVGVGDAYFINKTIPRPRFKYTFQGQEVELFSMVYDGYSPGSVSADDIMDVAMGQMARSLENIMRVRVCEGSSCKVLRLPIVSVNEEYQRSITNVIYAELPPFMQEAPVSVSVFGVLGHATYSDGAVAEIYLAVGRICLYAGSNALCDYGRLLDVDNQSATQLCVQHIGYMGDCIPGSTRRIIVATDNYVVVGDV